MLFVTSVAAGATMVAPYKGAVVSNYNSSSTGGCAAIGKTLALATWSPVTGIGHFADVGAAKSCPKSLAGIGGSSSGSASGEFELAIPVKISTTGAHSVGAMWSLAWTASNTLTVGGVCPAPKLSATGYGYSYCQAYSDAYIYGYSYFVDTTNGTGFYSSTYWSGTTKYPSTIVKSHHYLFIAYMYGDAYASIYGYPNGGYPKASASATVNMATLGNGAKLTGISIT
jgi:hypothetical protein